MHNDKTLDGARKSKMILAIYGIVQFDTKNYLIVVSDGQPAVNIADHNIFRATKFEFVPLSCDSSDVDEHYVSIFNRENLLAYFPEIYQDVPRFS